jgi:hypothetical protein
MALLGLLGSRVSAQRPLIHGLQESGRPTVVPGISMTVKSFDSSGDTPQAPDPLSQTLASLFGAPLADAIQQGRNHAYPHTQPIPQAIRAQLTPFFPRAVLQTVRYSTHWDSTAEGTLPYFLLGQGAVKAVTLAIMKWGFATTDEKGEAEGYAVGGHRRSRGRVALVPRARALA